MAAFSYTDDLRALGDLRDFVVDAIRGKDPDFPEEQLDALVLVYDRTALPPARPGAGGVGARSSALYEDSEEGLLVNPMVVEQVELSTANWQDFLRRPTKTLRVMSKSEFVALKKRSAIEKAKASSFNNSTDITVCCHCFLLLTVAHRVTFPFHLQCNH